MNKSAGSCDINQGGICGLPNDDESLRKLLSPEQYKIIRQNGTERPFDNEYWNNHEAGIYVDRVSGEPLFSSLDKFDSGTGWPSFSKPIVTENVVEKSDNSHGMVRTEVRSKKEIPILGISSMMVQSLAVFATVLILLHCDLFRWRSWRRRGMGG